MVELFTAETDCVIGVTSHLSGLQARGELLAAATGIPFVGQDVYEPLKHFDEETGCEEREGGKTRSWNKDSKKIKIC